ncbi:MAG: hypothetical protein BWZ03_00195 [bacterium ADurb.BinA186]|nr:MAG: hypothetical protein BWZ03_00195 [bacterium ADurb.BinA186]
MAHIEICHPNGTIERINLFKRLSVIGRGESADIELKDHEVSVAAYLSQMGNTFPISPRLLRKDSL